MHLRELFKTALTVSIITVLFSFQPLAFGEELANVPSSIKTVEDLAKWISTEFSYCMEFPDKWSSVQDTINSKQGDCEDLAILASYFLKRIGIPNDLVLLKFRDLDVGHAICVWKGADGTYSFFTSLALKHTREPDLRKAISRYYPDWESIVFANVDQKTIRTIRR